MDGQGNTEPGGSNDDKIFFMKYPLPFLQYWYETFPLSQQETTTTGTSVVSSSSVGVRTDMTPESSSGHTQSKFPHLPPSKTDVFNHWTLVSDDLVSAGRNSGQYKAAFKCNVVDGDGKSWGADRTLLHYRDTEARLSPLPT